MGSQTARGYPYPVGTDRVMDGDDAIKALAEAVDSKVRASAAGSVNIAIASGQFSGSVAVVFPAGRFTAAPSVQVTAAAAPNNWFGGVTAITANGCNVFLTHRDGSAQGSALNVAATWTATEVG